MATYQGVHIQSDVALSEPANDTPECEVVNIAERPCTNAVTVVCAPPPQHRIQLAQQVCKCSMPFPSREQPHLVLDGCERLLGWKGVDCVLADSTPLHPTLDAPAQEVKSLIDIQYERA